jgi:hypothetical protein
VRYLIVAEADRDLKQLRSRLALTERLAVLLADTPADLLPTVCYLCQLLNACTSGKKVSVLCVRDELRGNLVQVPHGHLRGLVRRWRRACEGIRA